jgi:hypothetical protein
MVPDLHARLFDAMVLLLNEQWRLTLGQLIEVKREGKTAAAVAKAAV